MANDCKPRTKVTPVTEPEIPLPTSSCMEELLPAAPECMEVLESPASDCCPDDAVEHGWYNEEIRDPCENVVVPYAAFLSSESQEAADTLADQQAYLELDSGFPDWSSLTGELPVNPRVDIYGALGPEAVRNGGSCLGYCDAIAFCDGPEVEGSPMVGFSDRYTTRWQAKLESGSVYYRKEGAPWSQVSNELIPQPNLSLSGVGFCFDANGGACFSSQIGDNIHIWRYQDGSPSEYSIPGTGAKLFFDGVVQRENSLRDVVCYFCNEGKLCAAFQRENFAITHTLYSPPLEIDRVYLVDRVTINGEDRIVIGVGNHCQVLRTPPFPIWPELCRDASQASATINSDLDYSPAIVEVIYSAPVDANAVFNSDLHYQSTTVELPVSYPVSLSAVFNSDLSYEGTAVLVLESAPASASSVINSDIHYYQSIVGPLTETASPTANATFNSDIIYTV